MRESSKTLPANRLTLLALLALITACVLYCNDNGLSVARAFSVIATFYGLIFDLCLVLFYQSLGCRLNLLIAIVQCVSVQSILANYTTRISVVLGTIAFLLTPFEF